MRKIIFLLCFISFASGCMVGPNYQRPSVDVPQTWRFEDKEAKDVANTTWWEQFNDPVLNELIQAALKENKDLKVAAARIEQFVGRMETVRAPLFPQIGAGGLAGRQRVSDWDRWWCVFIRPGTTICRSPRTTAWNALAARRC